MTLRKKDTFHQCEPVPGWITVMDHGAELSLTESKCLPFIILFGFRTTCILGVPNEWGMSERGNRQWRLTFYCSGFVFDCFCFAFHQNHFKLPLKKQPLLFEMSFVLQPSRNWGQDLRRSGLINMVDQVICWASLSKLKSENC